MRAFAVILCGGSGARFGADKLLENLAGRPVWRWSYDTFAAHPGIQGVGLVCSQENLAAIAAMAPGAAFVTQGGSNRQESSAIGVNSAPAAAEVILIHDGARPFIGTDLIDRVLAEIELKAAAAPGIPVIDTLRSRTDGSIVDRDRLAAMQTPQGARRDWLLDAHAKAREIHTDDMALLQASGYPVSLVEGSPNNFKITTQYDLQRARQQFTTMETRTGLGYDIHRFSTDPTRPLMLGGIRFSEGPGLEGHSDADVVIHAIVDSLLGAAALGDIGQHFPPTNPRWKDEPSLTFLTHAASLLADAGWSVANVDVAIQAEKPRVMPQAQPMRDCIASALRISIDRVNIKATTNEGLGALGRAEGIAAFATATITR